MAHLLVFVAGAACVAASAAWWGTRDGQQAKGLAGMAVLAGLAAYFSW